jgi:hypothetical protein
MAITLYINTAQLSRTMPASWKYGIHPVLCGAVAVIFGDQIQESCNTDYRRATVIMALGSWIGLIINYFLQIRDGYQVFLHMGGWGRRKGQIIRALRVVFALNLLVWCLLISFTPSVNVIEGFKYDFLYMSVEKSPTPYFTERSLQKGLIDAGKVQLIYVQFNDTAQTWNTIKTITGYTLAPNSDVPIRTTNYYTYTLTATITPTMTTTSTLVITKPTIVTATEYKDSNITATETKYVSRTVTTTSPVTIPEKTEYSTITKFEDKTVYSTITKNNTVTKEDSKNDNNKSPLTNTIFNTITETVYATKTTTTQEPIPTEPTSDYSQDKIDHILNLKRQIDDDKTDIQMQPSANKLYIIFTRRPQDNAGVCLVYKNGYMLKQITVDGTYTELIQTDKPTSVYILAVCGQNKKDIVFTYSDKEYCNKIYKLFITNLSCKYPRFTANLSKFILFALLYALGADFSSKLLSWITMLLLSFPVTFIFVWIPETWIKTLLGNIQAITLECPGCSEKVYNWENHLKGPHKDQFRQITVRLVLIKIKKLLFSIYKGLFFIIPALLLFQTINLLPIVDAKVVHIDDNSCLFTALNSYATCHRGICTDNLEISATINNLQIAKSIQCINQDDSSPNRYINYYIQDITAYYTSKSGDADKETMFLAGESARGFRSFKALDTDATISIRSSSSPTKINGTEVLETPDTIINNLVLTADQTGLSMTRIRLESVVFQDLLTFIGEDVTTSTTSYTLKCIRYRRVTECTITYIAEKTGFSTAVCYPPLIDTIPINQIKGLTNFSAPAISMGYITCWINSEIIYTYAPLSEEQKGLPSKRDVSAEEQKSTPISIIISILFLLLLVWLLIRLLLLPTIKLFKEARVLTSGKIKKENNNQGLQTKKFIA